MGLLMLLDADHAWNRCRAAKIPEIHHPTQKVTGVTPCHMGLTWLLEWSPRGTKSDTQTIQTTPTNGSLRGTAMHPPWSVEPCDENGPRVEPQWATTGVVDFVNEPHRHTILVPWSGQWVSM